MSFILDALKKVDRKKDGQAEEGMVMQGGRVWGESRSASGWAWGAVLVLAIVTFGLAAVALFRSFQAETHEAAAVASEPQAVQSSPPSTGETPVSIADGTDGTDSANVTPKKSSQEVSPVEAASSSGVIEPSGTLPETAPVEAEVLAEPVPPMRLVGRGAEDRASPPANLEAEQEKLPADLPPLALQGTSVIDGTPVAVVNYQRVFEGDIIEGARVIKILDRAVELEFKGSRFTIRL
ncbi:MAG: hypothetical protein V3V11_09330 [Vicinamibacteria bacterium]